MILYDNGDEEQAALLAREVEDVEGVSSVSAWSTTLGRKMTPEELAAYFQSMMVGELSATLLVIFVLPGILAALDRFICGRIHG